MASSLAEAIIHCSNVYVFYVFKFVMELVGQCPFQCEKFGLMGGVIAVTWPKSSIVIGNDSFSTIIFLLGKYRAKTGAASINVDNERFC